jgi:hypothetical protein
VRYEGGKVSSGKISEYSKRFLRVEKKTLVGEKSAGQKGQERIREEKREGGKRERLILLR